MKEYFIVEDISYEEHSISKIFHIEMIIFFASILCRERRVAGRNENDKADILSMFTRLHESLSF